ncbi:unnamed protein product [Natator depressus]
MGGPDAWVPCRHWPAWVSPCRCPSLPTRSPCSWGAGPVCLSPPPDQGQVRGRGGSDEGLPGAPEIRSETPVRTRGLPPARSRERGVRAGGLGLLGSLPARGREWGPVVRAGGGAGNPDSWVLCLAGGKCSVDNLQAVVELALRPPGGI